MLVPRIEAFTSLHSDTKKTISISAAFTSLHYDVIKQCQFDTIKTN